MKILITGANGFVGKNLQLRLREREGVEVISFLKKDSLDSLDKKLDGVDFVFHLAGSNRPVDEKEFNEVNRDFTNSLCEAIKRLNKSIPIIYSSSIQAELSNAYGRSKFEAEEILRKFASVTGSEVFIFRLPNVFGKWCRPNYNSAVATFCYNIANDLPVTINDPKALVRLVYIDDVLDEFLNIIDGKKTNCEVSPVYQVTVGEIVEKLQNFKENRSNSLIIDEVGTGFTRALYATFISYLTPNQFSYDLQKHQDPRGVFVEMLKTKSSGQFSFFTAHPGITRGGHYHHTKTEKFLVVQGKARFRFFNMVTQETHELFTEGAKPEIVDTIPGWSHDITNIGESEMIVLLWANEIFDRNHPDTIAHKVY